jgi:hypothetical protein
VLDRPAIQRVDAHGKAQRNVLVLPIAHAIIASPRKAG